LREVLLASEWQRKGSRGRASGEAFERDKSFPNQNQPEENVSNNGKRGFRVGGRPGENEVDHHPCSEKEETV